MYKSHVFSKRKFFKKARVNKLYFLIFTCSFIFFHSASIFAQDPDISEIAPPPLKVLSKTEKKQLDEQTDIKKRTILALELMEARLKRIEELDNQNEFVKMYEELGGFHALMDYTLVFLYRNNASRKNLSNLKRYEMGLRTFPPRLEVIRRELPIKYESYMREVIKMIRDARSKAIEPFYGNTVVPNINN
jgi:hypothetical protein